jgi:hypothetical protein
MLDIVCSLLWALRSAVRTHRGLALENLALRHQLTVLRRRTPGRAPLTPPDRLLWVWLMGSWREWRQAVVVVQPETVIRWSRQCFRRYWAWKSHQGPGRPRAAPQIPSRPHTLALTAGACLDPASRRGYVRPREKETLVLAGPRPPWLAAACDARWANVPPA